MQSIIYRAEDVPHFWPGDHFPIGELYAIVVSVCRDMKQWQPARKPCHFLGETNADRGEEDLSRYDQPGFAGNPVECNGLLHNVTLGATMV